ncbi:MAG: AAA family ATPase [Patescibacteria group bacterium]
MKLVYIYGAPAAGKLSVAKELAKLTGYGVLHNHLFNDLVEAVLDYDNEDFFRVVQELRRVVIAAAVRNKVEGVIMTFCYAHGIENDTLGDYFGQLRALGVEIECVHLVPDIQVLRQRVQGKSRQKYGKLKDPKKLESVLQKYDFYTKIPFAQSLVIDNTDLAPEVVAGRIVEYINK